MGPAWNGDLTCSEALRSGGADGLRLPAYQDNRNGTALIYEWLTRRRGDPDGDGIDCESSSNPNSYVPTRITTPPGKTRTCSQFSASQGCAAHFAGS